MELSLEQIKELMASLKEFGLTRLNLKVGEMELSLVHEKSGVCPRPRPTEHHHKPEPKEEIPVPKAESGEYIVSPMVGAFYSAPSPDDSPFVKVGDHVDEGTVVCIIEAMKVMNEVKAGKGGTIKKVLVDNAAAVEFGTKLFEIE